jgi:NtrC-family two-component system sensor histidine kinase KinB
VNLFSPMLRTRLFLGLLPLVVIFLAAGVYAIALISRLAADMDVAINASYKNISDSTDLARALDGVERAPWVPNQPVFEEQKLNFEKLLAQQSTNSTLSAAEQELNKEVAANYNEFLDAVEQLNRPRSTPKAQSPERFRLIAAARITDMTGLLKKIRDFNYQRVLASNREMQQSTRRITRLMVIGFAIVLTVSIITVYQLSRAILTPIQLLTKATRELGEGNLNQTVPIVSKDELGQLARAFNKMAAQLQEYRRHTSEEIVRLHRTMETTLASFPDPIFVLNNEGRIELKNPAATDLNARLQSGDELPENLQGIARKVLASGENFLPHSFDEVIYHRTNGAEKYFLPRVLVMRDKENNLFGVAVVLYDVTRFRLLDGAKTNLVGTVSHELKSPLTSVRMALHILLEKTVGDLTPQQDELLQAARNDTERLLRILNDLLDLARLDERGAELHKEKVAPAELLQRVIEENADKISARGLRMQCTVDPSLPSVLVDRQRIGHVFTNLLSNAVKHSPPGGEIQLRATRVDGEVQFSVTDHGAGIPEELQLRIFDRFFRVPGQTHPGAGLGLSIAKEIAQAHGGRIGVTSSPGHGSTFFLLLKAA